ncbi:hypothetical protein [Neobacillus niacini]|uniref:hypothetical protein n=1 Tax=Neobacillus niacini TaxID=86668 RepID=UPI00126A3109|nr:hypothetical protein [Neobacillus niacini]
MRSTLNIDGVADIRQPQRLFAVMNINGRWVLGDYVKSGSVWFRHQSGADCYRKIRRLRDWVTISGRYQKMKKNPAAHCYWIPVLVIMRYF